jgi:hypothetical protein
VKVIEIGPSMVISLSSYSTHSLPRRRCPASDDASADTPSIRSLSPQKTQVRWFTSSCPGRL